ncbi:ferredoxin [Streptomyces lunaelactis]|uniref:ferredoxin n=1 Tax=Streptomyces lunaelactis TaxID=1535768 RepID=UPI00158542BC|nr:ferredoxin [Streptomyces lunaelactis]NUK28203.1 ferredoxin [Streptomyces lunaelactis]NUK55441.1 ferredoxin [Streptomyces lunaelactis]NUK58147.1 ferredoxin [Streptomyces lunaelactis]NUK62885.1 ferredoxin [Streptomyces lunaelactis]NUK78090.1 ferredoxin [Streptomyces lunaelactis]
MKLLLDSTLCQGYGLCQEHAPELVELDEWGYAAIIAVAVPDSHEEAARDCAAVCPNSALRLEK